ncbi:MAG: hypothetical protein IJR77_02255 [Bacteroidales bacterium]|nr:hypothetical protein [Bacteroidales bacterium]
MKDSIENLQQQQDPEGIRNAILSRNPAQLDIVFGKGVFGPLSLIPTAHMALFKYVSVHSTNPEERMELEMKMNDYKIDVFSVLDKMRSRWEHKTLEEFATAKNIMGYLYSSCYNIIRDMVRTMNSNSKRLIRAKVRIDQGQEGGIVDETPDSASYDTFYLTVDEAYKHIFLSAGLNEEQERTYLAIRYYREEEHMDIQSAVKKTSEQYGDAKISGMTARYYRAREKLEIASKACLGRYSIIDKTI